jgi:hypothetical protein
VKFKAELFLAGKTATGIRVPDKVVEGLGAGKRPPVTVTFNGYTYRTTVAPMCGEYFIPVAAAIREASGATAGDMLTVTMELDTEPRTVEVPEVLAKELAKDKKAAAAYEKLSYSNKKEMARSITEAKAEETRARRLAKALESLRKA